MLAVLSSQAPDVAGEGAFGGSTAAASLALAAASSSREQRAVSTFWLLCTLFVSLLGTDLEILQLLQHFSELILHVLRRPGILLLTVDKDMHLKVHLVPPYVRSSCAA